MPSIVDTPRSPFFSAPISKNDIYLNDSKDYEVEKHLAGLQNEKSANTESDSAFSLMSVSSIPLLPKQKKEQLGEYVKLWEQLHQSEGQLLGQAQKYLGNYGEQQVHKLAEDIVFFVERKNKILKELSVVSRAISSESPKRKPIPELHILQQPSEIVNSLISPSPIVNVNDFDQWSNGPLTVRVTMLYASSERAVIGNSDEEVLQGPTKISVDSNGTAYFNSLRIEDLCSKDRRQTFLLEFILEDQVDGMPRVLSNVKSDPFTIQIRPSVGKRKRDLSDDELNYRPSRNSDNESDFKERKMSQEYNYVDITDLLTLPQKEAAQKLGISESMLCKRFKECTRRKWPYRYLCKIEKVINLMYHQSEGQLSEEDCIKLEHLKREREECLQPVKIRIIPHENGDLSARSPSSPSAKVEEEPSEEISSPLESAPLSPLSPNRNFSDEEQFVLETLELLKSDRKPAFV